MFEVEPSENNKALTHFWKSSRREPCFRKTVEEGAVFLKWNILKYKKIFMFFENRLGEILVLGKNVYAKNCTQT